MSEFTAEEKEILKRFFTSINSDTFCLVNLPEVVKGSLFSRYSRSAKSVRRLFLDEFYNGEIGGMFKNESRVTSHESGVNSKKAEEFYERVLVGYGDDSVAELGGVHIATENISCVLAKLLEDARVGISPLEKSSRYVFFDKKVNNKYTYYREPAIMKSRFAKEYEKMLDMLFDTYSHIVREMYELLVSEPKPSEAISDIAYKASCRAKACDVARYLLPMAAHRNVGLYGNGRAFEYLLIKLAASPLEEARTVSLAMHKELSKVIPAFVHRAYNERGVKFAQYLKDTVGSMEGYGVTKEIKRLPKNVGNELTLFEAEKEALDKVVTALLFPHSNISWERLFLKVKALSEKRKTGILEQATRRRENRHHKALRGFEQINYSFEIVSDIGAFYDLQRHRVLTQYHESYTTLLGFNVPVELNAFPKLKKLYIDAMERVDGLYRKIARTMPHEAQYVVPMGYRIRYMMRMNLREAIHLTELRSGPQGHSSYRYLAQEIAKAIVKKHPLVGKYAFKFVDYNSYKLERLAAFQKIAEKAGKMGIKAFEE
ncbi:MAG: FAD-dependent thymidylate synthase [Patescibacteria group bacterium]|jgi:thymidylate synthase ThyX